MHPLSDKDLDRLSREAADHFDVDQNTSGWEKLEQKLNKQLPEAGKKERRRFLFLLWLFALLSGGGLSWLLIGSNGPQLMALKQGTSKTAVPVSKTAEDGLTKQNKSDNTSGQPERKDNGLPGGRRSNEQAQGSTSVPGTEKEIANRNADESTTASRNRKIPHLEVESQRTSPGALVKNNARLERKGSNNFLRRNSSSVQSPDKPLSEDQSAGSGARERLQTQSSAQPGLLPAPKSDAQSAPDSPEQSNSAQITKVGQDTTSVARSADSTATTKNTVKNKGRFQKGLGIGLVAAPDMSNVRFTNTDKVGFNVGIQMGYRLSSRWSLNTGVLYTRKNYTSRGKDFNPPKGTWLDNVSLYEVEGNCFMFDIPLNVRYDLNSASNQRYFLSTGLSTYFMKKESYDYYYRYANGSPGHRYRSYPSEERHWFSVLNISAGFEKKLSRKFSWQAEPYLKIPLTGVGHGNIQLNSYGMYFSLKYKPGIGPGKK